MKILAPINIYDDLDTLAQAGADEFFFGFYEERDTDLFGPYFELNRMSGFGRYANNFTFEDSLKLVRRISEMGKDSYVTLNSSGYTEKALARLDIYILELVSAGVTGCIVSCPELMEIVRSHGGRSVISCVGTVYNSFDCAFYKRLGATRIIVPRDLTMDEIRMMIKDVPDMEYETFIMRNGCILSDGNCLGLHKFEHGGICRDIRRAEKKFFAGSESGLEAMCVTQDLYDNCLFRSACAACAIYRMIDYGITACKLVGRVDRPALVLEDLKYIRKNIDIAADCGSEEEYFERMVLPEKHAEMCPRGYSCYFPEIVNPRVRKNG